MSFKTFMSKAWHFIWHDNSLLSWIVNIILAFLIVKFILYPGIGFVFGTDYPIVAVMSGSMEHDRDNFDSWWFKHGDEYTKYNITKDDFLSYRFVNGFNKGDLIVAFSSNELQKGDVIIFAGNLNYPLIHRLVVNNGSLITKGDNNIGSRPDEVDINKRNIFGKARFRIPYVGWIKIWFMNMLGYDI